MRAGVASLGMLLMSLLVVQPAGAQDAERDNPMAKQGMEELERGRVALDPDALANALASFSKCLQADDKNWFCEFALARVDYFRAVTFVLAQDRQAAEDAIATGIQHAQRAIKLNSGAAEPHSGLADLYTRRFAMSDVTTALHYGRRAQSENRRALHLNPNSAYVQTAAGRAYFFSPATLGGDLEKAAACFRKATELDPRADDAFVWLAIALGKLGDLAGSQAALQKALEISPKSVFAAAVQSGRLKF